MKRTRGVALAADEGLSLPRLQHGIREVLAAAGVDVARCGAVLDEVMRMGEPSEKLKAVEIYFKVTVGFAPTKSANLHADVPVDAFFNDREFEETPPIRTLSHEDVPRVRESRRSVSHAPKPPKG